MIRYTLVAILSVFFISACTEKQEPKTDSLLNVPEIVSNIDSWHKKVPTLANAHDSASFIIGYLNGNSLSDAKKFSEDTSLKNLDNEQFLKGVAMALEADSTNTSMLLGIMAGMEMLGATKQYSQQLPIKWDSQYLLRGYYHGLNRDLRGPMPSAMIESELNNVLGRIYQQGQSNK